MTEDEKIKQSFKEDSPYFYEELLKHPNYHQTEYNLYKAAWIKGYKSRQQDINVWERRWQVDQKRMMIANKTIESLKCCGNCGTYEDCLDNENAFYRNKCDKWKMK